MGVFALVRRSILGVCVLAPFAVAAVACTSDDVSSNPADAGTDTGTGDPTDTGALPGDDAGGSDSGADAGGDAGGDAGADSGALPTGVVHQLSYHQLTTKAEQGSSVKPAISRNGSTIVWSSNRSADGINRVYVTDGTGGEPKLVDTYPAVTGAYAFVAISDDGNIVASTDGLTIRVVDKTGAAKGNLVFSSGEVSNISLNGTGSEVYLVQRRDNSFPATSSTTIQRGLYKWTPGATTISPLVTAADVKTLIGGTTTVDDVFPFASCGGSGPGYSGLANSSDGSKVYVALQILGKQLVVETSNAGAAGAKVIFPAESAFINAIATSADGSKLAVNYTNGSTAGAGLDIIGADGTGRKKIADVTTSCGTGLSMTSDGSTIASVTGFVRHVDGSDAIQILAATGTPTSPFFLLGEPGGGESDAIVMSGDGKRFAYLSKETGGASPYHIAIAELDSRTLGTVPTVSDTKVSRASVPRDNGVTNAFVSAKVAGASPFVGSAMFNKGLVESVSLSNGSYPLLDDGKNSDKTAGDGIFTSPEQIRAYTAAEVGPRVIRVKAEIKDAAGKRQAHALDFGPFEVK